MLPMSRSLLSLSLPRRPLLSWARRTFDNSRLSSPISVPFRHFSIDPVEMVQPHEPEFEQVRCMLYFVCCRLEVWLVVLFRPLKSLRSLFNLSWRETRSTNVLLMLFRFLNVSFSSVSFGRTTRGMYKSTGVIVSRYISTSDVCAKC